MLGGSFPSVSTVKCCGRLSHTCQSAIKKKSKTFRLYRKSVWKSIFLYSLKVLLFCLLCRWIFLYCMQGRRIREIDLPRWEGSLTWSMKLNKWSGGNNYLKFENGRKIKWPSIAPSKVFRSWGEDGHEKDGGRVVDGSWDIRMKLRCIYYLSDCTILRDCKSEVEKTYTGNRIIVSPTSSVHPPSNCIPSCSTFSFYI